MGVSGCGKSTVAALLAGRLNWPFEEGDDLHPAANVAKMHAGHPLTDEDRWPRLAKVAEWIDDKIEAGSPALVTCSALKRSYGDVLRRDEVYYDNLRGTPELIDRRLAARQGHFMPPTLLDTQFADLQVPESDEKSVTVDIGAPPATLADGIISTLGLRARPR
jgi:carbohydrate kinase (thermoresistant glucokinase family)